jgi:hypothetical protein
MIARNAPSELISVGATLFAAASALFLFARNAGKKRNRSNLISYGNTIKVRATFTRISDHFATPESVLK